MNKLQQLNFKLNDELIKQRIIAWLKAGTTKKQSELQAVLRRFKENAEK